MQNAFDPSHFSSSETPSLPAEAAWKSWLVTAVLVFAGVTLGGMVAGLVVPEDGAASGRGRIGTPPGSQACACRTVAHCDRETIYSRIARSAACG